MTSLGICEPLSKTPTIKFFALNEKYTWTKKVNKCKKFKVK
jgi:hypothetical protein